MLFFCRECNVENIIVLEERPTMTFCSGEYGLKTHQGWMTRGTLVLEEVAMRKIYALKVLDRRKVTQV